MRRRTNMHKTILAALAATTVLLAGPAIAQQGVDFSKVEVKVTDLGNKTYMLEGQGGNVTIAVGTDGIIMVDTQFAPMHDKLKAAIAKISPLPIKQIVITHFHGDHTGGIAAFQGEGANVISQDNIRLRLAAGGNKNGTNGQSQPPAPAGGVPKETYSGGTKTIEVGGRKGEIHHVFNAPHGGDTWVALPESN